MPTIRDHFYHSELPLNVIAKIHPFVAAVRPHGTACYQDLSHADRLRERELAHLADEWRAPACYEDDKAMDVVQQQHQMNRSYHWVTDWDSEPTDDGW